MGVLNVTPDSFSDGGRYAEADAAIARGLALFEAGADVVDVGGESTRPGGAAAVDAAEERRRVLPVVRGLRARGGGPLSIDTTKAEVAAAALDAGADLVNDVSGLTTAAIIEVAATSGADFVAMHNLGIPADRARTLPADQDPTAAVERWLAERLTEWQRAGLDLARITFDPGIGFGKNALQSLRLLRNIERFHHFGLRLLVGHSRKSFMHHVTAASRAERDLFTIGVSLQLCARGVDVLRVHDVAAHTAAYRGWAHVA